eukprot:TRINITY_DN54811_c0_g1_i1.p1 TRINITY_DN54811_c0_g1~~TRINITY_DN54811_c0_g1_i1.p1  ORF type:complete len:298 (-),score=76.96 TRINITY_DN54811_c0_g1_i1:108-1001(-)
MGKAQSYQCVLDNGRGMHCSQICGSDASICQCYSAAMCTAQLGSVAFETCDSQSWSFGKSSADASSGSRAPQQLDDDTRERRRVPVKLEAIEVQASSSTSGVAKPMFDLSTVGAQLTPSMPLAVQVHATSSTDGADFDARNATFQLTKMQLHLKALLQEQQSLVDSIAESGGKKKENNSGVSSRPSAAGSRASAAGGASGAPLASPQLRVLASPRSLGLEDECLETPRSMDSFSKRTFNIGGTRRGSELGILQDRKVPCRLIVGYDEAAEHEEKTQEKLSPRSAAMHARGFPAAVGN